MFDDLPQGHVVVVRALGVAPADVQAHALRVDALEGVVDDLDVHLDDLGELFH